MPTTLNRILAQLFTELAEGSASTGGFILNASDVGLLRSLDALSARDASQSSHGGATVAAHAQHLRYGLSLMNRWATEGGNPFAEAQWDQAWRTTTVDEAQWSDIRDGLRGEARRWREGLRSHRGEMTDIELLGVAGSVAHLAYHLGAIRQITAQARGPKDGTMPDP